MKKIIPNMLTILRILLTPVIIYLGIKELMVPLLILAIFVALTDFLDGKLARLWNVSTKLGAKLDAVGDKVLAIGLLIILVFHRHVFFYVLILESLMAIMNFCFYLRKGVVHSLLVGKLKTWIIFVTIFVGLLDIIFPRIYMPVSIFVFLTVVLQAVCIFKYIFFYFSIDKNVKKKLTLEDKKYYEIVKDILNHEEFLKRKTFEHHYNESVYDHVLRVSYDCYKIGRKLKLDYKSLAIAGLLHDFYEKPWQDTFEYVAFFQRHGFVHAEEARVNAKKYFPELVNTKIESMIKTHMFPLNRKLPETKEAWLLTLIDKADSMNFLLHPLLMSSKFRKYVTRHGEQCAKRKRKTKQVFQSKDSSFLTKLRYFIRGI